MGTIYKRRRVDGKVTWCISYMVNGRRIREAVGPDKKQAEQALKARLGEIAQGRFSLARVNAGPRFTTFAEQYLEYARTAKRSWTRDETSLRHMVPFFGEYRLAGISSFLVEKYKAKRREEILAKPKHRERDPREVSMATVNRELACLKHMFTKAIEWGLTEKNPVKQVKLFPETPRRLRFLSPEEIQRLLAECSEPLRSAVLIGLTTGMRVGEILELRWEQVDFRTGLITVERSKGGRKREIPMSGPLTEALRALSVRRRSSYVISRDDGEPRRTLYKAFQKALKEAGIADCTFHTLRHTYASHLVMAGVDLVTVKELLGHQDINMTMRYAHLSADHKRKAVEAMSALVAPNFVTYLSRDENRGLRKAAQSVDR